MTQLTDKVFAFDVANNAHDFKIVDHKVRNVFDERDCKRLEWDSPEITHKFIILPPGTWRFLFTTKAATEEDARKVVDRYGKGWKDYNMYHADKHIPYELAIDSFETLLRSKGLDPENNFALIEKESSDARFDYKTRNTLEKGQPAPKAAIDRMKERWMTEGKRECPDCGLWFKSEGRCPECNPMG